MKFIHYIYAAAVAFSFAACDDFNDRLDGFDDSVGKPVDIKNVKYTVTENDYAKFAKELDVTTISTNKAFETTDQAHASVPFLLQDLYPVADNGSMASVGYYVLDDATSCLSRLRKAKSYTLAPADYEFLENESGRELSLPAFEKIPELLLDKMAGAKEGDIVMVNYDNDSYGDNGAYAPENMLNDFTASKLYEYDGTMWNELSSADNVAPVAPSVYHSMAVKFIDNGETIMPKYLDKMYPFAKEGDTHTVAYYYNKYKDVGALKYTLENGEWTKVAESFKNTKALTVEPYVLTNGKWHYDPNVSVELPAIKNNDMSVKFYQAMTDWVWANVDKKSGLGDGEKGKGYVVKFGNTDYYSGASAYDCVADWRIASARTQCPDAYKDMTDDELLAHMQDNFRNVLGKVLANLYPDAKPVDGLDVLYTITFTARTSVDTRYSIQYKVVGKAAFQYVEGSMQQQ